MIPLSVPNLNGNEWKYVKECLDTNWVSSVGAFVDRFEKSVAEFTGAKYAISTVNGSAALHISLMLAGVQQNDYVILPNITFVASANTITYVNASPLLIDINAQDWQMDLDLLETFLNEQTYQKEELCYLKRDNRIIRAIMPVHVLGNVCDIDRLIQLASKHHLTVIEDATESLGTFYRKQHTGTFGLFGCLSFNGNKIITTGGGGMILTNDESLAKKAKHITTQAKSDPFEYVHDEIGYNYRLVNILAAMGLAQMEQLPEFLKIKKNIAKRYQDELSGLPGFAIQKTLDVVNENNWLQTFRFDNAKGLIQHLLANEIQVRPFWVPMNQLEMFKKDLYITKENVSDNIYKTCISLPCSTNLKQEEQSLVIDAIKKFYASK